MELQLHVIVYRGYLMLYRVFVFIQSLIFFEYQLALALDCDLDLREISIFYATVHILYLISQR
jgi:hypothetical protein